MDEVDGWSLVCRSVLNYIESRRWVAKEQNDQVHAAVCGSFCK
jgi:hypothetical protein